MKGLVGILVALLCQGTAHAMTQVDTNDIPAALADDNAIEVVEDMEEFDPERPDAEELLKKFDAVYEAETGESPYLPQENLLQWTSGCYQKGCAVWAQVSKADQMLNLYVNGALDGTYLVSTGVQGHSTPDFDQNPDGRIYKKHSSSSYPGGDWNGLGNMPNAVFIRGGYALHGTPRGNWKYLGKRASHGCIRMHPTNAEHFNGLVRQAGRFNTWITVK
jgi:hypothetical protein